MSIDRKDFLKLTVAGGLGVVFGGMAPASILDRGARLVAVKRQSLVMGSVISFEVIAESESAGYEAIRKGVDVFRSLDKTFSMYDPESEMAQLAKNAGASPIEVSKEARKTLSFSKEMHEKSGGFFDVTLEPAMRLWGFRKDAGDSVSKPGSKELKRLKKITGSQKLQMEGHHVLLQNAGMAVDMGGIAGGYALDSAVEVMKKGEVSAAFINFSGDIATFGKPLHNKSWEVHILDPETREPLRESISLNNEALSTSGAYQNRRGSSAQNTWGHLMLPDNLSPVEPVASLTTIHSSAMVADAWSTAGYVGADVPDEVQKITI